MTPGAQDSPQPTLSVQVAPPHGSTDESGSTAGVYQPTPLGKLRAAAKSYFPDMFNDPKFALPDQFEQTWANPCWTWESDVGKGGAHCLPAFLILGVYQSGVRDLYNRLARHPGVAHRPATSPSYYSQVKPDWPGYLRELDHSVTQVGSTGHRRQPPHTTATTDATITDSTTATGRRGRAGCWARRRRSPSTSCGCTRRSSTSRMSRRWASSGARATSDATSSSRKHSTLASLPAKVSAATR